MTTPALTALPLNGIRVLECHGEKLPSCARMLADLGAEVVLVEPPGGGAERRAAPLHGSTSLAFEVHHANKRSVVLDLDQAADRARFSELLAETDLLIESLPPGRLATLGLAPERLLQRQPRLVVLSISDYGQTGPWRDQVATEPVLAATSGLLSRSGLPGQPPLLPPSDLLMEAAAGQAAWVALLALWQQARSGQGDWLDFSIREATAHTIDPALGVTGSAWAGRTLLDSAPHGRPPVMPLYPVIPCRDGSVRLCVLNPRQWEAMRDWLGTDHPFTDPKFGGIAQRLAVAPALNKSIAALFARQDADILVAEGQRRGIPIARVAQPAQVLSDAHFAARQVFRPVRLQDGSTGQLASGYWELNGQRAGWRSAAPALGAHTDTPFAAAVRPRVPATVPISGRPLEGLRVLDMGVIVAGAEAGRIFADMGADVIKVETRAFPDGGRQSLTGDPMTPSIAQGHRNKRSFGVNLRSQGGIDVFRQLVAQSDVLLSNFKPGTLDALGIGPSQLLALNPRLVMMDSSALGNTGPLAKSLGYGPLVRASTGLSWLWRYPEQPDGYCDGVTIYPDHLAGRIAGIGVLAMLLGREVSGHGGCVSVSQAEIFINSMATHFLRESLQPGSFQPRGNRGEFNAPEGLYACAGNDEWCAVSVPDDAAWRRLLEAIDRPDLAADRTLATVSARLAQRDVVEQAVQAFTAAHTPEEVVKRLQAAGIPAGKMVRVTEFRDDAQFQTREFIAALDQPGIEGGCLPTENRPVLAHRMLPPPLRPAPYQGEHTREIALKLLSLPEDQINALIEAGDLEDCEPKLKHQRG